MEIKIILIFMLVGCSFLLGEYIYNTYNKRHKELCDLIRILEILHMELSFGLYTLEEVFRKLGDKKEYSFSEFFSKMSEDLSKNRSSTLEEILRENIKILKNETYLAKREEDELKSLILSLGKSDIYSQERIINLTVENLKKLTDKTQDDINTKGLVYRKVTTIVGLVVGIILV